MDRGGKADLIRRGKKKSAGSCVVDKRGNCVEATTPITCQTGKGLGSHAKGF